MGGFTCLCLHCGHRHLSFVGGLAVVAKRVRKHVEGTPWYLNGGCFGAAVADEGGELGKALRLGTWLGSIQGFAQGFGPEQGQAGLPGLEVELDV
jgi:hypothetical protein